MVKHRLWSLSSPGYGFSSSHVWMWELDHKESGAPKNWCFKQWCWKRLFRVPWTSRRSNQSILKEISPEDSLEGLMLKLKLQYFGHLTGRMTHLKRPWCWERLKVGGEGDYRRWNGWMASPTQRTWVWVSSRTWWWTGKPGVLQSMGCKESDITERLNWIELKHFIKSWKSLNLWKSNFNWILFEKTRKIHFYLLSIFILMF